MKELYQSINFYLLFIDTIGWKVVQIRPNLLIPTCSFNVVFLEYRSQLSLIGNL